MSDLDPSSAPDPAGEPCMDFDFPVYADVRNGREHRFMESSDVNAAFDVLFAPLRQNIRRGLTNEGQFYALEMDACVPGAVLACQWIPPAARGVEETADLAEPAVRAEVFAHLQAEPCPFALFAYVAEQPEGRLPATLFVEMVSADGRWVADYPIGVGLGWHRRELLWVPHRRV